MQKFVKFHFDMATFPSTSSRPFSNSLSLALALLLPCFFFLSACDSGGTSGGPSGDPSGETGPDDGNSDDVAISVSSAEVAQSIVASLGKVSGGIHYEISDASTFFEAQDLTPTNSPASSKSLERSFRCDYNGDVPAQTLDYYWECGMATVGSSDQIASSTIERDYIVQFFETTPSGPSPVRESTSADSMALRVDDGSGILETGPLRVRYQMRSSAWGLTPDEDGDYNVTLLTSTAGRSITSTYTGRDQSRFRNGDTYVYESSNLVYRPGTSSTEASIVSGSVKGIHDVTITTVNETGTVNERRSIDVEFEAIFSGDQAEVNFIGGSDFVGEEFSFDPSTGILSRLGS